MKFSIQIFSKLCLLAFIVAATTSLTSCDDDEADNTTIALTGKNKIYTLNSVSNPAMSGTVKFEERQDRSTLVTVDLDGTTSGNSHPAHFHANSALETGDIIIDLSAVDGATGKSETVVTKKNDGNTITYDQLLTLDAYVNVHKSASETAILIAQGDIGSNEITSTFTSYTLASVNNSGISGAARISKRANGTAVVMVDLDGASVLSTYPVYIYDSNITTTGPIAINLNPVNGATGISMTNVTQLNSGSAIMYDQLVDFNGNVGVVASASDPTRVAEGNIGSNN